VLPDSGLHLDVARRRVGVWLSRWSKGLVPALAELWPGWTVTFWGDKYEEQLALCDDLVAVPPVNHAGALDELESAVEKGKGPLGARRMPTEQEEWEAVRAAIAALR